MTGEVQNLHTSSKKAKKAIQGTTVWAPHVSFWGDNEILLKSTSGLMKETIVIGNSQPVLTKRYLCLTNLIAFCDEMTGFVNMEKAMGVIYLDFHKAFNTVSVEHYTLDGWKTRWVKSWLDGWDQRTLINGSYAT